MIPSVFRTWSIAILCAATPLVGHSAAAQATTHHSELPWQLRPNFRISVGDKELRYALDNGQWRIERKGGGEIVGNVDMTITRTDGTVFKALDSTYDNMNIEETANELGPCRRYVGETKPVDGIDMRNYIDLMKEHPFMLVRSEITNVGDKPLAIAEIRPAVFGSSGAITGVGASADVATRPLRRRGGYPVYDPEGPPSLVLFHDPSGGVVLSLGAFPLDGTPTAFTLEKSGAAWEGAVVCDYGPGYVLQPGDTLKTVPVWLAFFTDAPEDIDRNYGWAVTALPKPQAVEAVPDAWVSVDPGQSEAALLAAVQSWAGAGIDHARVPAVWSGNEGYPYDARALAGRIRDLGMTPGLTVDPLALPGAPEALTVAASDGRRWLNVAAPEGRAFAVDALKKPVDWKYGFFVVAQSDVPDDALRAMGLTRGEADDIAFAVAAEAAPGRPVLPEPAGALGGDMNAWLEAAAATARGRMHGMPAGPLALDTARVKDPSEGLALAISLFGGPVEVRGSAGSAGMKGLFPRSVRQAVALDPEEQAPKLWQITQAGRGGSQVSVVVFPGGGDWTDETLPLQSKGTVRSLTVRDDGRVVSGR